MTVRGALVTDNILEFETWFLVLQFGGVVFACIICLIQFLNLN